MSLPKLVVSTALALIAFAGNSVLCRLALSDQSIDAGSFTLIRLLSGALVLGLVLLVTPRNTAPTHQDNSKKDHSTKKTGGWAGAGMLFIYAICFSYAYISLDTGTGALILFGTVQITMIVASLAAGNKHHISEWIGMLIAFAGFVYLVLPGISGPSLLGFILMALAGVAWGLYTLSGKGSKNPLGDTAYNFLRTLSFCVPLLIALLVFGNNEPLSQKGVLLAISSGALASGLGYTIWYIALGGLSATQAAVLQLLVPVLATFGGVIFANELISFRLILSSISILGGISILVLGRRYFMQPSS